MTALELARLALTLKALRNAVRARPGVALDAFDAWAHGQEAGVASTASALWRANEDEQSRRSTTPNTRPSDRAHRYAARSAERQRGESTL